ncbi:MAG TPA: 4-alpha-glucanotransferase [Chloroflexota bacterium]|nr:4-alpha-glucanotransferase [Chloroflexota bacterium]
MLLDRRRSGVLLHPTSLPSRYGIGDLGPAALEFVDYLAQARQALWQVLPLCPTGFGDSPYASPSAFAGNPLLVALEPLLDAGLLDADDLAGLAALPTERVDFGALLPLKRAALETAFARAHDRDDLRGAIDQFRTRHAAWLADYALFSALKDDLGGAWTDWDAPLRSREPAALQAARDRLRDRLDFYVFSQFLFFEQWVTLRSHARNRGVAIVGDIPIFVAHDSADVWANQSLFKLDEHGHPTSVAGVPPDYFSATGQLWGNPLYDWDAVARDGYAWWIARFRHLLELVDLVRIDHFRGFEAAWEVPAGAETAVTGRWVKGPGVAVFHAIADALGGGQPPVVAEDLGLITDEVRALLGTTGFPGMKVLQFAFGDTPQNPYLPDNYADPNCVVYTGTHDNDTTRGWFENTASTAEREFVTRYLGTDGSHIAEDMMRLALASAANTAIVPLQDVLNLGSEARMNTPGAPEGNWTWRVRPGGLDPERARCLAEMTSVYGRSQTDQ